MCDKGLKFTQTTTYQYYYYRRGYKYLGIPINLAAGSIRKDNSLAMIDK